MNDTDVSLANDEVQEPIVAGEGDYFRIQVEPSDMFVAFRTQDVGNPGGLQRIAGQQNDGEWVTQAWLIHKVYAHIDGDRLVADNKDAKELLSTLTGTPTHYEGDTFKLKM